MKWFWNLFPNLLFIYEVRLKAKLHRYSPWSRAKLVLMLNKFAESDQYMTLSFEVNADYAWTCFGDMYDDVKKELTLKDKLMIFFVPFVLIDRYEQKFIKLGVL